MNPRDLLILTCIPGIGPWRLRALVNHFHEPQEIARASARELIAVEGIEKKTALDIVNFYRRSVPSEALRYADDQLLRLRRTGGRLVTIWEGEYPANLKRIYDPPPLLFVRGSFTAQDDSSIAIVGTRSPTPYGVQIAERFSSGLSKLGLPIISGLARGIDTCAHAAAVKTGGRTIAVIGSGVDIMYPPENAALAGRIIRSGAVVSEYPMGTKPDAGNFPRRNRIISGIALGTVIVETGVEGGAMITAAAALEQNREVFAVPSVIGEKRRSGTNLLIKEGKALLTESVEEIIAELAPRLKSIVQLTGAGKTEPPEDLSLFEQQVYEALGTDPVHIDALAARAGLTTADTLVHLLSLEFKGAVRQMPGKMFLRVR